MISAFTFFNRLYSAIHCSSAARQVGEVAGRTVSLIGGKTVSSLGRGVRRRSLTSDRDRHRKNHDGGRQPHSREDHSVAHSIAVARRGLRQGLLVEQLQIARLRRVSLPVV